MLRICIIILIYFVMDFYKTIVQLNFFLYSKKNIYGFYINMDIQKIQMTGFGADFVSSGKVKKLNKRTGTYEDTPVSFVRINPFNQNDFEAMTEVCKQWQHSVYTEQILEDVVSIKYYAAPSVTISVYALTAQNKDFNNLKSEDILGFVDVRNEDDYIYLDFLETKPEYKSSNKKNKEYRNIGTEIINNLKKLTDETCNKIKIWAVSDKIPYYEKNGFVHDGSKYKNSMIWRKND